MNDTEEMHYLTQEKYEELTGELEYLKTEKRREIAEQLEYARSLGDLSENAEYHEARDLQGAIEGRIRQIEDILARARVIEESAKTGIVRVGSKVTICKVGEKEERSYEIVGTAEANMRERKVSHLSPLGKAMIGLKKGASFEFETPNGTAKYKVINVS